MTRASTTCTLLVAALVIAATVAGFLQPATGTPIEYVTPAGDQAFVQSGGLYGNLPVAVAREGMVWDFTNLVVGVPALLVALWAAHRGSLRGRLVVAGLSLYFAYAYLTWSTLVFNAAFLVYVAIFGLSLVNLFLVLSSLDAADVRRHASPRFPRAIFAGFAFVSSGMITLLWVVRISGILVQGHFPPELAGLTSLESQALDLGIVVPLSILSGIYLLKDHRWGYILTALQLTMGFMMFLTIPAWIAVPLVLDGSLRPLEAAPFLLICGVGLSLALLFLTHLHDRPLPARRTPDRAAIRPA